MSLIQTLPHTKIDVIGDCHGELQSLISLLAFLGYYKKGKLQPHPEQRILMFVGDFVDRGPNSLGVLKLVKQAIDMGIAHAVLGNHELNTINEQAKPGSAWFFPSQIEKDKRYEPYATCYSPEDVQFVKDFINDLPVAIETPIARIVHAMWDTESVNILRNCPKGNLKQTYDMFTEQVNNMLAESGLTDRYHSELAAHKNATESPDTLPPFLHNIAKYQYLRQKLHPLKCITNGAEHIVDTDKHFFVGGKWRYVYRHRWWEDYSEQTPVIFGHYWRKFKPTSSFKKESHLGADEPVIFFPSTERNWLGPLHNTFCIDYSAGGKFMERLSNLPNCHLTNLVALRLPEQKLITEEGHVYDTIRP